MKKIFSTAILGVALLLTGCLETTQEITINNDGTGTLTSTNDMSKLIGLAKTMGGDEMKKAGDQKIDSNFAIGAHADSIPGLNQDEKNIASKGNVRIQLDVANEKFSTAISFPFAKVNEVGRLSALSNKVMAATMKDKMGDAAGAGADITKEMADPGSIDDYYTLEFSNGELSKKVNKEKYATAATDEYLKGLKEAANMGLDMTTTYVINLPRPAIQAEGKNVNLSADKKKITITASLNDFFEDAAVLEFKIKY